MRFNIDHLSANVLDQTGITVAWVVGWEQRLALWAGQAALIYMILLFIDFLVLLATLPRFVRDVHDWMIQDTSVRYWLLFCRVLFWPQAWSYENRDIFREFMDEYDAASED